MSNIIQFQRPASPGTEAATALEFASAALRLSLTLALLSAQLLSLQLRLLAQALQS